MTVKDVRENYLFPDLQGIRIWDAYVTWSILVAYLSFTKLIGPILMKNRKPFALQHIMILYNALMVASNIFLSVRFTRLLFLLWPYRCNLIDCPILKESKDHIPIILAAFYVKLFELFETVLFVLRKKHNQISFLHLFHHSIVVWAAWFCFENNFIKFHVLLLGAINTSIHVVMYLYYGLAALGPGVRKYLWWKKYFTKLQIIQFFTLMLYMASNVVTGCERYSNFDQFVFVCLIIITVLFFNFYVQEYRKKK